MGYLTSSLEKDIVFKWESKLNLVKYSSSEWIRDHSNRKLICEFIFTFNKGPISYDSKKQGVVAFSSTIAEYVALYLVV